MEQIETIYKLIGTSLLSLLVIGVAYLSYSLIQQRFNKPILSNSAFVFTVAMLTLISLIILIWRVKSSQLELIAYFVPEKIGSELLISIVLVASFISTQAVINWAQSLRTIVAPTFNQVLAQWDAGKVSDTKVKKEQVLYSLHKWIEKENETGWYELDEQVTEKITDATATWIILKELNSIQQKKKKGNILERNHNYERRLESLITVESVGEVWQKWDRGLVSEEVAHEAQEVNAFKKWVLNGDETGWIDLEFISRNRKTLSPRVIEFADCELQEILARKNRHETIDVKLEQRLKKLVLA